MTYILDGLYLGGYDDACDSTKLTNNGVTHILTVDIKPLPLEQHREFAYLYVHSLDMDDFNLLDHFPECVTFIDEGRRDGGVLVHCLVGESRSSTVTAAYLMHKMDMSVADSITLLRCQRPQIRPNDGFMEQLSLYEEMCNTVDSNSQAYKQYRMTSLANQVQMAQTEGLLSHISADPGKGLNPQEVYYKCRKCRRALFKRTSVMSHAVGCGQAAFSPWKKRITNNSNSGDPGIVEEDQPLCQGQSLFIEPVQWMGEDVRQLEGKLSCPKCAAKLGSFKWTGECCPCGSWVTPAFHVQVSKVDLARPPTVTARPPASKPLPQGLQLQGPEENTAGDPASQQPSNPTQNVNNTSNANKIESQNLNKTSDTKSDVESASKAGSSNSDLEITKKTGSSGVELGVDGVVDKNNKSSEFELVSDLSTAVGACNLRTEEDLPPLS